MERDIRVNIARTILAGGIAIGGLTATPLDAHASHDITRKSNQITLNERDNHLARVGGAIGGLIVIIAAYAGYRSSRKR